MHVVQSLTDLRPVLHEWRREGKTLALVPTMGNLHAGHLRLVEAAQELVERVAVSIFVNPTQFAPGEDFQAYPRTPDEDLERLRAAGAHLAFLPAAAELYPADPRVMAFVEVPGLSDDLCGRFRPGHFRGVATVVCKLFNLVQPDVAVFGEKDYQQLAIIRRMTADLDLPVRIHGVATVREPGGLAMSSRNAYLSAEDRERAASLYAGLREAAAAIRAGRRDYAGIEREWTEALAATGFQPDYFAVRRQGDLAAPGPEDRELVILVAARLGRTRLIDNLQLKL